MTPIAHGGHWAVNLLYLAPVVIIALAVLIQRRRDRRQEESDLHPGPRASHGS